MRRWIVSLAVFLCLPVSNPAGAAPPVSAPRSPAVAPAAAPAVAPAAAPDTLPAYLTATRSCAVVVGGSVGSAFADRATAAFWHEVNKQITDRLFESLVRDRYHAIKLTIPVEGHGTLERMVGLAMLRGECNRILQVSHTVGEDDDGAFFQISLTLLQARPSGARVAVSSRADVVMVDDFNSDYRYRRDKASFDAFRTASFARAAYLDLKASGRLERLR